MLRALALKWREQQRKISGLVKAALYFLCISPAITAICIDTSRLHTANHVPCCALHSLVRSRSAEPHWSHHALNLPSLPGAAAKHSHSHLVSIAQGWDIPFLFSVQFMVLFLLPC